MGKPAKYGVTTPSGNGNRVREMAGGGIGDVCVRYTTANNPSEVWADVVQGSEPAGGSANCDEKPEDGQLTKNASGVWEGEVTAKTVCNRPVGDAQNWLIIWEVKAPPGGMGDPECNKFVFEFGGLCDTVTECD